MALEIAGAVTVVLWWAAHKKWYRWQNDNKREEAKNGESNI